MCSPVAADIIKILFLVTSGKSFRKFIDFYGSCLYRARGFLRFCRYFWFPFAFATAPGGFYVFIWHLKFSVIEALWSVSL